MSKKGHDLSHVNSEIKKRIIISFQNHTLLPVYPVCCMRVITLCNSHKISILILDMRSTLILFSGADLG